MIKFYTGVGSRKTPQNILNLMTATARKLAAMGYILRTGDAIGADTAFNSGAGNACERYTAADATTEAEAISKRFHPAWNRCKPFARKLHARNAFQVLGRNLQTPSAFLICWTPEGETRHSHRTIKTGGTGTAISIADNYNIPVFNLANPEHCLRIKAFALSKGE